VTPIVKKKGQYNKVQFEREGNIKKEEEEEVEKEEYGAYQLTS
jgi:hypothetical protein